MREYNGQAEHCSCAGDEFTLGKRIILVIKEMLVATLFFALLVLAACTPRPLFSRPITSTHTPFGAFSSFKLQFALTQNTSSGCLIETQFPQPLHSVSSQLRFALSNEFGDLLQSGVSEVPSSNNYYFRMDITMNARIWYQIQIWPAVTPTLVYGLVGMAVVSQANTPNIVYQSSAAFEYYHLEAISLPPQNIVLAPVTAADTKPAAAYAFQLRLTSSVATADVTTVSLTFCNQNYSLLTSGTPLQQNNNFKFIGSCQVICDSTACLPALSCSTQNNKITLVLPQLGSQPYMVQFYVLNPNFVDATGLAVQLYDSNGLIKGANIANNLFATLPIAILPAPAFLHWGIPLDVVTNTMALGLFVGGGWNTLDFGFTLSSVTAIGSQFVVTMYVGATRLLQHSINTNLPQLNATSLQRCSYSNPYITCRPIDSFTSTTLRYYISFKAYFASTDPIASLASVAITLLNNPNTLFTPLTQNLAIPTIKWDDYHDYTGFHNPSAHNIQETQIIGGADSGLVNATSTFMDSLTSSAFVGIDPQIGNQQLVFLLQTTTAQMSKVATTNQSYQMRVYFNPNPFQSISDKGIDFTAYSATQGRYQNDAASCYVDSSANSTIQIFQCQPHNDYVYNIQYDNTLSTTSYYGLYSFLCGNGQKIVCATANCAQSCRIFKGQSLSQSYSGVFSLRNVTFKTGYQSPYLANNMALDFIVAFYQAGARISASLINAYTLKSSRPQLISSHYHNVYLSASQTNLGSRVPTLLELQGRLSLSELSAYNFNRLMLFLPNQVTVNSFIQDDGKVGCSSVCSAHNYVVNATGTRDNWLFKQAVKLQSNINLQSTLNFKLPVVISASIVGSLQLALFANSSLLRIYRLHGSSVGQSLTPSAPTLTANASLSPWSNPDYWVMTATDQYKQALNLNQISAFSSSNTIDMLGSLLTYAGSPSSTFTSIHQSVFSTFFSAVANNLNSCDLPFTYLFNSNYNVTVLWCPLSAFQGNQIVINYPYYPNNLGSGFPFSQVFSYGFEDGSGSLIAFRTQSGSKSTQASCSTTPLDIYNYAQVTQQPLSISLTLSAVLLLSPATYTSFALLLNLPTVIPVNFLSCEVQQMLLLVAFSCSLVNTTTNSASLVLTYNAINPISVLLLEATVWLQVAAPPSVVATASYSYSVAVVLPQTDALNMPAFYGLSYTLYSSTIESCSSLLTLSSITATVQPIILTDLQIRAISLNYLCELSWSLQFSHSRRDLLPGQQIIIQLANVQTTGETSCFLQPENYSFDQITMTANRVILLSQRVIDAFSLTAYRVVCKQLILQSNALTVTVQWLDGGNILQQSNSLSLATAFPSTSPISSSITAKNYNTLGYDSQYHITVLKPTTLGDRIEMWIDFKEVFIHSLALQCYYYQTAKVLVFCAQDWSGKVHVALQAQTMPNITIAIYGIRQFTLTSPLLLLTAVNGMSYFVSATVDAQPANVLSAAPITIQSIFLSYNTTNYHYCLTLQFAFPVAYSSSFYVVLDDSFLLAFNLIISCQLNGVSYLCSRAAPNLLQVASTSALLAAATNTLSICGLVPNSKDFLDSLLKFKIFTNSGQLVSIGSHDHKVSSVDLSSIVPFPNNLQEWSYQQNTSWTFHIAYVGYYAQFIQLSTIPPSPYRQPIDQNYTSSLTFANTSLGIDMGESQLIWSIAATSYSHMNLATNLQFSTSSLLYPAAPDLPVYVSDAKCAIAAEYSSYQIYTAGVSIPIMFDFSQCKPVSTHSLAFTLQSPYLAIDSTLSNSLVNSSYFKVYVVIKQIPTSSSSGSFTLQTAINGPYASSFYPIAPVTIQLSSSTVLQIPQSQPPFIAALNDSFVNFSMQCSLPSTIYWALALSPVILGVTAADLQAKLTIAQMGLVSPYGDAYSWAGQTYGFTYAANANQDKFAAVGSLQGSRNYNFKYFCVNQLGYPSTGQILNFTTPLSPYGLTKISLTYKTKLTIKQANRLACQMAEVLVTPYHTVTTSTFSNCFNTSNAIYRTSNTTFFDELTSQYGYFFYISSRVVTIAQIISNLPKDLPLYQPFIASSPVYNSLSTMALSNNYEPAIISSSAKSTTDSITFTADVGVTNAYLVLAYLTQPFNITSMSLPTTYLIKQGSFSTDVRFNQVYMAYGRNNITVSITQLSEYQNYSLFYYATVDDPALNARSTQVYYLNVQTLTYVVYYLHSNYVMAWVLAAFLICL